PLPRGDYARAMASDGVLAPRQRWSDVSSLLRDLAITSWDVAPQALARHLPPWLSPDVFVVDGCERAFVSAVTFTNVDFFVGFAPFLRLRCQQTNYRAYVRRGEERAAWFFATSFASPWVVIPRTLWRLPWARAR